MLAKTILGIGIASAIALPALAASYPISGAWGESTTTGKDKVDCTKVRVIDFRGEQRTDTKGGVNAYRNVSVNPNGAKTYKVVDQFSNGQIKDGRVTYTLKQTADDRIEMNLDKGGTLKLQRCSGGKKP